MGSSIMLDDNAAIPPRSVHFAPTPAYTCINSPS
jgi:hypothetical protein